MPLYSVSVFFKIKSNKIDLMHQLINQVYAPTKQEPGCIDYRWHQSSDNPTDFFLWMVWESYTAFMAHENTEHVKAADQLFVDADILSEPYQVNIWEYIKPE